MSNFDALLDSLSSDILDLAFNPALLQSKELHSSGSIYGPTRSPSITLPSEILDQIFSYVDSSTLALLSRANHAFQEISERILYRNIKVSSADKSLLCFDTLVTRPSLAHNTRTCEIGDLAIPNHALSATHELLSKALHNMMRLMELSILLDGAYAQLLLGCPFQLRKLTSALHYDRNFCLWLQEQHELTTAFFCGRYLGGISVVPGALPKLTHVSASPLILSAVVPMRPIRDVEICLAHPWLFSKGIITTTMRIMTMTTVPMRSLRVFFYLGGAVWNDLAALDIIAQTLPGLESFAMHIIGGAVTTELLIGLQNILSKFHSLRSLMVLSKDASDALHDPFSISTLAAKWHRSCQTLECVSFPSGTWVHNQMYGWVTLKVLERILQEREKALQDRERDVREKERLLYKEQLELEEKERKLQARIRRMAADLESTGVDVPSLRW